MTRTIRDGVRADEVDLGVLFGDAWRALRANLGAFFGATLLATVMLAFAAVIVGVAMWAQIEGHLDPALGLAGEYVGHAVLAVVGQWVFLGGLRMCLAALRGRAVEATDVFDADGALVPGLVAGMIVNLLVGLGVVMCIVPGIIVGCATALAPLFVVDKRLTPIAAVRASIAATRGRRFTVFAMYLSMYLFVILGLVALGLGLLVAIPFCGLVLAALYERTWPVARPDA